MKNTFKIIVDSNPILLEVGRNVLDMTINISKYINANFEASDFFTIGNTRHIEVTQFLEILEEVKMKHEDISVKLSLSRDQYHVLISMFWYGSNFGDDIPELAYFHDDIHEMYHIIFSKT